MPTFLSPPTQNAVRSNRKSRTPDACIQSEQEIHSEIFHFKAFKKGRELDEKRKKHRVTNYV